MSFEDTINSFCSCSLEAETTFFYSITDVSRVFLGIAGHISNPQRRHQYWRWMENFEDIYLQMREKYIPQSCLFLYFLNYLRLHYETLLSVDDFEKNHSFIWYLNKKIVWLQTCESCQAIWEDGAGSTEGITGSSVNNLVRRKHFCRQFLLSLVSLLVSLFFSSVSIFVFQIFSK